MQRLSYRDYNSVMNPASYNDGALEGKQPMADDRERSNEDEPGPSGSSAGKSSSSYKISRPKSSDSDEEPPKVTVDPGIGDPRWWWNSQVSFLTLYYPTAKSE